MGAIELQNAHLQRSSSMTFALRWKHENVRMAIVTALFTLSVLFMFFMLIYSTATKAVALVVNGEEIQVKTKQADLRHLLDEQAIKVGDYDQVSNALTSKIRNGDRIIINLAAQVQVTADGESKTFSTHAKTVSEALQDMKIAVGPEDKITPALDSSISNHTAITIVRVKKEQNEVQQPIAFETVTQEDADLLKGKEQVVQEGKEGVKVIKTEKVFEDGKLVAENPLGETVQSESVKKIVAVGTKNPVVTLSVATPAPAPQAQALTPAAPKAAAPKPAVPASGAPSSYKQIINNVTLTAYSAGLASTGKTSGDAGFGKTASGTTVSEGRTIAVDPSIIPLGWWVYIEGIGYRRAEDTGSAIKGNKIDVYYDSEAYAQKFGLKRGYTVYVVGPNKPSGE